MIDVRFHIKDKFSKIDPAFLRVYSAIEDYALRKDKIRFIINISYNHGGEIAVMRDFVAIIETAATRYENLTFDLRFGGFAVSAAAFVFCYFVYFTKIPRVRVSSGVRLCIVFHKPRSLKPYGSKVITVFDNKEADKKKLTRKESDELADWTKEFDEVLEATVETIEAAGGKFDQHLLDSYNSNGDLCFTLYPQVFKVGHK